MWYWEVTVLRNGQAVVFRSGIGWSEPWMAQANLEARLNLPAPNIPGFSPWDVFVNAEVVWMPARTVD